MPGRIFISYSKADPEPTRALADFLTAQGYSVWWDTNLTSGEVFREVIDRELAAADAVIVIWTAHSVASNWVISEADDAARRGKLITVRTKDLEPWRIPKPYNTYQADPVENRDAVLAAVRRVAGEPPKPEVKSSPSLSEATVYEALALEHWQAIKASADPAKLHSFLNEFGGTKCASLARTEYERLAEREWRKLANSKDVRALHGFCLLFPGTLQMQLARSLISGLTSNPETMERFLQGTVSSNRFASFINRHPMGVSLVWLLMNLPLILALSILFHGGKWSYLTFTTAFLNFFLSRVLLYLFALSTTAFYLLQSRRNLLQPDEIAIYWFGWALSLGAVVHAFWIDKDWPAIIGSREETANFFSVLIIVVSGVLTLAWWKVHRRRWSSQEIAS